jgi:hypothetical protein
MDNPLSGVISREGLGIRRLTSCTYFVVVIPTEGRDLWVAEQAGRGAEQRRASFWQRVDGIKHRSFQEDKARVSAEQGQPYSRNNQLPACGRDDKVIVIRGR